MSEQYKPFDSGSQFFHWHSINCSRCAKCNPEKTSAEQPGCTMEMELSLGSVSSGTVSMDTARRCGAIDNAHRYVWNCPELEAAQ